MDIFNTKKIAALEARIAALEPRSSYDVSVTVGDSAPTVESLDKRVKELEEEVLGWSDNLYPSIFIRLFDKTPEKLTLLRKVERICEHLKIRFVTEPQRTVIKPVKK